MSLGLDIANLLNSPLRFLSGVNNDAWEAAIQALQRHESHSKLERPLLMTLVDFTKSSKDRRLWTFHLLFQIPLVYTPVAHGKNSGGAGVPATKFANDPGSHKSCVGAFATYHKTHASKAGHVTGTGLRLHGLDPGINDKALSRGIIFHGADYVKASGAGRSFGCFATIPEVNERLLPMIAGGTFVYAWGG
jgi:L,D-transpeptidase catalytic domain